MEPVKSFDLNIEYSTEDFNFGESLNANLDHHLGEDSNCSLDDDISHSSNELDIIDSTHCGDFVGHGSGNVDGDDIELDNTEPITPPHVGMAFGSAKELIHHCHEYGKFVGFQIRIRSSEKKHSGNGDRDRVEGSRSVCDFSDYKKLRLECSKSGKFRSKSNNPQRAPSTVITGCQFKVNASLHSDGLWKLTTVILSHNHPCAPEDSRFMTNYRYISEENRRAILNNDKAGVPIAKNFNSFIVQYGSHDQVPFSEKDCRNLISKARKLNLMDGDFVAMRRYFESMSSDKANFFYMYDTDETGTLTNVFWADGRSRAAYQDFGDVVSFDTTYVSNRYKMPFAPFIGVNHHGQSILFGCALLGREETQNFVWLFKAWLTCMSGKAPKAILTDQCKAIGS